MPLVLRSALAVAVLALAGACGESPEAPKPVTANLWVDAATADGPCRFAARPIEYDPPRACDSLREAYETATDGGTVRVRPGRYPDESSAACAMPPRETTPLRHTTRR